MKTLLTLSLFLLLGSHGALAQRDSLRFAQDTGRVEKQRFMDTYDYVFMTKEPTKWMLKLTIESAGVHTFSPLMLRFEKKITPAFSLQFGVFPATAPIYRTNTQNGYIVGNGTGSVAVRYDNMGFDNKLKLALTGEARWYYALKKRIADGKSMNNFSANYFSLRFNNLIGADLSELPQGSRLTSYNGKTWESNYDYRQLKNQIMLNYGIQRRFLKSGLIDFSVGLSRTSFRGFNQNVVFKDGDNTIKPLGNNFNDHQATWTATNPAAEWMLQTNLSLGLAFGDFKKSPKRPLCDVLHCFESETSLLKVRWPIVSLGLQSQYLSGGLAYERKLFNSALSLNTSIDFIGDFRQNQENSSPFTPNLARSSRSSLTAFLQPRFYFTQARRIRRHSGGNNLSGVYVAASAVFVRDQVGFINFSNLLPNRIMQTRLGAGPSVGFQQKLFRNGFIDFQTTVVRNLENIGNPYPAFEGRIALNLGFAF